MPDSHGSNGGSAGIILLSFLLALSSFSARAHDSGQLCQGLAQTVHGKLSFNQVEMVSRRHDIGLYRGGPVHLSPWLEVSDHAFLGIDGEGRLLQIVVLEDRTVGFLLSGQRELADLFLFAPNALVAIGRDGQLYQFHWSKWSESKLPQIIKRAGLITGATACVSVLATWVTAEILQVSPWSGPMLVQAAGLSSVAAMMQGFFATVHFERDNENTDGFLPLPGKVPGFKLSERVMKPGAGLVDYELTGSAGKVSLMQLLRGTLAHDANARGFDRTCEHALLPRGIPPENYEPKL